MTIQRAVEYIQAEDSFSLQQKVAEDLHNNCGYNVINIPGQFLFATPKEDTCIPVLLHANFNAGVRDSSDEPVILSSTNLPLGSFDRTFGTDMDVVYKNDKGILGGVRAGVALVLEAALTFKQKPFILLTRDNNSPFFGMKSFINKNILAQYVSNIHLCISATRSGYNYFSTKHTNIHSNLIPLVQSCGLVAHGIKMGDIQLVENNYNISCINMSCGVFKKNTPREYLSSFGYYYALSSLVTLMESVAVPYRAEQPAQLVEESYEKFTAHHILSYPNTGGCCICGKPERHTEYDDRLGDYVCQKCVNRMEHNNTPFTPASILTERTALEKQRSNTRAGNMKLQYYGMKRMPKCPHCNSSMHVHYSSQYNVYWCKECDESFWLMKYHGKKAYTYLDKEGNVVTFRMNQKGVGKVLHKEQLSRNSRVRTCDNCGALTGNPRQIVLENPVRSYPSGKPFKVVVNSCPDCVDILKEMSWDLLLGSVYDTLTQGSEDTFQYTFYS